MQRSSLLLGRFLVTSSWEPGEDSEKYGEVNDSTCSKHISGGPSSTSESWQQGEASWGFSHALSLPLVPVLELRVPQTHPYSSEVSLHKTLFQQIPYLLSRECLQQLKPLSALSQRLMAIIKAVLSSPLLFFAELLGSREWGCASQQEPWKSMFSSLVCIISLAC